MDYKRLKIKTITPMLSHGISRYKPEFRVTELKSAMRFWWRAINTFENLKDMKKKEGILFGDSENNCSPFRMKAKVIGNNKKDLSEYHIAKVGKTKEGKDIEIKGIHIDKDIEITLYSNKLYDSNLEFYVKLIKLVSFLGGLGQRSRRGYGAFNVEKCNNNTKNQNPPKQLCEDIKVELKDLIDEIIRDQNKEAKNLNFDKTEYHYPEETDDYFVTISRKESEYEKKDLMKYPYIKNIYIGKSTVKWIDYSLETENQRIENQISNRVKNAIDNTRRNKLTYKGNKGKLACPVYVTWIKEGNYLIPMIVELNNTNHNKQQKHEKHKKCEKCEKYEKYINKFKEAILKKGAENE